MYLLSAQHTQPKLFDTRIAEQANRCMGTEKVRRGNREVCVRLTPSLADRSYPIDSNRTTHLKRKGSAAYLNHGMREVHLQLRYIRSGFSERGEPDV